MSVLLSIKPLSHAPIAFLLGAAALTVGACSGDETLSGNARALDGDTIEIAGEHVRLHGIDAPELAQDCFVDGERWACGREATRSLAGRIAGQWVVCTGNGRDQYGRILAFCRTGEDDLNAWLVAEGWALAYRRYSSAYVDEEEEAQRTGKGVWRGDFVAPWDWRGDGER